MRSSINGRSGHCQCSGWSSILHGRTKYLSFINILFLKHFLQNLAKGRVNVDKSVGKCITDINKSCLLE